jgi:hypothetical protein
MAVHENWDTFLFDSWAKNLPLLSSITLHPPTLASLCHHQPTTPIVSPSSTTIKQSIPLPLSTPAPNAIINSNQSIHSTSLLMPAPNAVIKSTRNSPWCGCM